MIRIDSTIGLRCIWTDKSWLAHIIGDDATKFDPSKLRCVVSSRFIKIVNQESENLRKRMYNLLHHTFSGWLVKDHHKISLEDCRKELVRLFIDAHIALDSILLAHKHMKLSKYPPNEITHEKGKREMYSSPTFTCLR